MAASYVSNIIINSGTDFSQSFVVDIDLTGYEIFSQLRKHSTSSSAVSFACTFTPAALQSTIGIGLSASQTLAIKPGRYLYDVLIRSSSGVKTRVVEGMALVSEGITKL